MLPRIEYSVSVPVPVDAAFRAFQNLERLLHRGIYNEASWIEGRPWEVGSRLRHHAASLGQVVPGNAAIQHTARILHLAVADEMNSGSRTERRAVIGSAHSGHRLPAHADGPSARAPAFRQIGGLRDGLAKSGGSGRSRRRQRIRDLTDRDIVMRRRQEPGFVR